MANRKTIRRLGPVEFKCRNGKHVMFDARKIIYKTP